MQVGFNSRKPLRPRRRSAATRTRKVVHRCLRGGLSNQQRGLSKMASIVKLIGKLARIVIGMVQRGETYRSPLPQPSAA
ncbi:hypothetical protein B1A99_24240 [Cohnella sp. CIP 111063]|nr:hypothetical protein B1A99_24240 [Cohnella sp. CIP 111063]